jgi:hypothetical protein
VALLSVTAALVLALVLALATGVALAVNKMCAGIARAPTRTTGWWAAPELT